MILKRVAVFCAVPLALAANAHAQPQDASPTAERTLWDHNGSIMYLVASGSSRELHYQKPRPGMLEVGAHPDDVLFKGEISDGQISGTAYIFNAQCGQVPFRVKGPILDNGEKIVLTGQAPRVGRNCQAYGEYTSTLEFKLLKTTEVAQPQTPATAQTANVEQSKPEQTSSRNAGEVQTAQQTVLPKVEQPKPEVLSNAVGAPNLPVPPSAEAPLAAQTPAIESPKSKLHESEPKEAGGPSVQPSLTTTAPIAAPGFIDKNRIAPLIIAMNVVLPLLSILFLISVLRSNETPP